MHETPIIPYGLSYYIRLKPFVYRNFHNVYCNHTLCATLEISVCSTFLSNTFILYCARTNGVIHSTPISLHPQDDKQIHAGQKWKLPPNGQPICLFSGNPTQTRTIIRPDDDSK